MFVFLYYRLNTHIIHIDSESNLFFSSISISIAFSMLREGARGESLSELSKLLSVDSNFTLRDSASALLLRVHDLESKGLALTIANALFLQKNFHVRFFT